VTGRNWAFQDLDFLAAPTYFTNQFGVQAKFVCWSQGAEPTKDPQKNMRPTQHRFSDFILNWSPKYTILMKAQLLQAI